MVNAERSQLRGGVEVDELEIGGTEPGRKGGRQRHTKAVKAMITVEVRGTGSGRSRMQTIADATAATLGGFVRSHVCQR